MEKLDFNIDDKEKITLELLNCQVDLILRSLEFYCYTYQYIYPRKGKTESNEENLRLSLVRDTYHQICACIRNSKSKDLMRFDLIEKDFEKFA